MHENLISGLSCTKSKTKVWSFSTNAQHLFHFTACGYLLVFLNLIKSAFQLNAHNPISNAMMEVVGGGLK